MNTWVWALRTLLDATLGGLIGLALVAAMYVRLYIGHRHGRSTQ